MYFSQRFTSGINDYKAGLATACFPFCPRFEVPGVYYNNMCINVI